MKGMRAPRNCQVGRATVAVLHGNFPTLAIFRSGEHGRGEAGHYHFWTAMLKEHVEMEGRVRTRVIARAQALHPPGERFERIGKEARTDSTADDRRHNRALWSRVLRAGRNVDYIRPSTVGEVARWVRTHRPDARHITRVLYRGEDVYGRILDTLDKP